MHLPAWLLAVAHAAAAVFAATHALLYKRDARAAFAWCSVSVLFPLAGPLLYFLFGINRVQTRARRLFRASLPVFGLARLAPPKAAELAPTAPPLARLGAGLTGRGLIHAGRTTLLVNGDETYPAMLDAINNASTRVYLASYIFATDGSGRAFCSALRQACERGVDVRVLVDGFGVLYSWPRAHRALKRHGVPVARYLPPRLLPPTILINLRNHRKILVADELAFTGGINIGDRYVTAGNPKAVRDVHFRFDGPIARELARVFERDWAFASGQDPTPGLGHVPDDANGNCRIMVDGPDDDMDYLAQLMAGALAMARRRVLIMTPYFLPSRPLISALQTAALRGLQIDIVLPGRSNLPFVHWATRSLLWELLSYGVRIHYQRGEFVHTKLFVVDDDWALIGSANIDARSLRLNFELCVELFDPTAIARIVRHFGQAIVDARPVTLAEVDGRSIPVRLRDAICWLFSPYL